jgi:hypothetical protein
VAADVRRVPLRRALDWYAEAMRLWKRAPATLCALAFLALGSEFLLQLVPEAGMLASKVFAPIVACGLFIATDAVARGGRARIGDVLRPFAASAAAIAAIVVSNLLVFAAEAGAAWAIADVDLLRNPDGGMTQGDVLLMFAVGMLVSLPLTLVPLCGLFDGKGFTAAFDVSIAAFRENVAAFVLYGLLSYALLVLGLLTLGLGLLVVLPLWATSSYAAWRDLVPSTAPAPAPPPLD